MQTYIKIATNLGINLSTLYQLISNGILPKRKKNITVNNSVKTETEFDKIRNDINDDKTIEYFNKIVSEISGNDLSNCTPPNNENEARVFLQITNIMSKKYNNVVYDFNTIDKAYLLLDPMEAFELNGLFETSPTDLVKNLSVDSTGLIKQLLDDSDQKNVSKSIEKEIIEDYYAGLTIESIAHNNKVQEDTVLDIIALYYTIYGFTLFRIKYIFSF